MFDFDKSFEEYAMQWVEAHRGEMTDDELEDKMPALYDQWADTPLETLSGLTPRIFFATIDPPDLIKLMVSSCDGEQNPSSLMLDRIADTPACAQGLCDVVRGAGSAKARVIASNLLTEMGAEQPLSVYVSLIADDGADESLRETGIEILCDHAEEAAPLLYPLIPSATTAQKGMIAEVLACAPHDDRTLRLLEELFASGDNIPFYAGLLGKYGDERACGMLYRALDTCNYLEYIEIKNAIERMGGVVDDVRDFSEDPYYIAVKHLR